MSNIAILTKGISKQYRIGQQIKYKAFRDVLSNGLKKPLNKVNFIFRRMETTSAQRENVNNYFWALKDISFEIKHGEAIAVIGRNGAGKSTLLKILSRITAPTKGEVEIRGRVGSLLEVGTGFHPELTGRENIILNGAILGMRRKEILNKFDEIVDFAEIDKFINTPVKHYSSGMYVRLAFAVAAHFEPEILLVDEVLAVGDAHFQKKCLGKMGEVSKMGRTVIFVSHNMMAVNNLCTKAILLDQGKIVDSGNVTSVIEKYLSVEKNFEGEVSWKTPDEAPGNHLVKLKAIRIYSNNIVTDSPSVACDMEIQIDFWNLREGGRWIGIHLINALGQLLFTTNNVLSNISKGDEYSGENYSQGLFRAKCTIPKYLLNPGKHSIDLFINGRVALDSILSKKNIISFTVVESDEIRKSYFGEWKGAVRPILNWETTKMD
jgi:lipopolysaccharide transport system ATP-binding protein